MFPSWARPPKGPAVGADAGADAAFFAGAGLALLDKILRADPPFAGELDQQIHQFVRDALLDGDGRQGHAPFPRATEGGIDDPAGGAFHRRIFQHQRVILSLAKALHPLAVRRRRLVDMQAHRGGTYKRDPLDIGVLQNQIGFAAAARHQVHHAAGQARLVKQFQHPHGCHGSHGGSFQHEGVPGGDAEGHHPSHGDHGRKIKGCDSGEHAQWLAVEHRVVARGGVHGGFAHHQRRDSAGQLNRFLGLQDVAGRLFPHLAVLLAHQPGLVDEVPELVQHLNPLDGRRVGPAGIRVPCRFNRAVDLFLGAQWRLRDHLAGTRVEDIGIPSGF